ncbi:uncharacterized protein [Linepithema humile]|uniref:uncharacterized protein n=1 Tax=Linepithema humile TaxID=83485 RepID=UPI0006233956|nr:PREDICTED: uncharacterized protein LOC105680058 [Linepithema humile]
MNKMVERVFQYRKVLTPSWIVQECQESQEQALQLMDAFVTKYEQNVCVVRALFGHKRDHGLRRITYVKEQETDIKELLDQVVIEKTVAIFLMNDENIHYINDIDFLQMEDDEERLEIICSYCWNSKIVYQRERFEKNMFEEKD